MVVSTIVPGKVERENVDTRLSTMRLSYNKKTMEPQQLSRVKVVTFTFSIAPMIPELEPSFFECVRYPRVLRQTKIRTFASQDEADGASKRHDIRQLTRVQSRSTVYAQTAQVLLRLFIVEKHLRATDMSRIDSPCCHHSHTRAREQLTWGDGNKLQGTTHIEDLCK